MPVHAGHKKNEVTRSTLKSSGITTIDEAGESREGSQIREAAVQYYYNSAVVGQDIVLCECVVRIFLF